MSRWKALFSIDLRALALARIAIGLVVLTDLADRVTRVTLLYSDQGMLPRGAALAHTDSWRFSLHLLNGHVTYQVLLIGVAAVAAAAMIVGYRTRSATFVCWLLLVSLDNRNRLVVDAADTYLSALLLCCLFLPLGARCAIDSALNTRPPLPGNRTFSAATVAVLLQVGGGYLFAAVRHFQSVWSAPAAAASPTLALQPWLAPLGEWLRQSQTIALGLTNAAWTVVFLGVPLLFFPWRNAPIRSLTLAGLATLHGIQLLAIDAGLLPAVGLAALLLFVPGQTADRLAVRRADAARRAIRLYYDGECAFCRKVCLLLRAFCLPASVPIVPAQEDPAAFSLMRQHDSWVVFDHDARPHVRWDAVNFVLRQSPLFWLAGTLLSAPVLRRPLDKLYGLVGAKRIRLGASSARWLPYRPLFERPSRLASSSVIGVTVAVGWLHVAALWPNEIALPTGVKNAAVALNLWHDWSLYSATSAPIDGWYTMPGRLTDGRVVDALGASFTAPTFAPPATGDVARPAVSYRERLGLARLRSLDQRPLLQFTARYLCDEWHRRHPAAAPLRELAVYFTRPLRAPSAAPRHELLFSGNCVVPNRS